MSSSSDGPPPAQAALLAEHHRLLQEAAEVLNSAMPKAKPSGDQIFLMLASRVLQYGGALQVLCEALSGGYAGAKATQRFLADYAGQESRRNNLGIEITAVLPRLTPATELGRSAVAAYAVRLGISEDEYLRRLGKPVTPQIAGAAFVRLAAGGENDGAAAYMLTADGLQPLPDQGQSERPRVPTSAVKEEV